MSHIVEPSTNTEQKVIEAVFNSRTGALEVGARVLEQFENVSILTQTDCPERGGSVLHVVCRTDGSTALQFFLANLAWGHGARITMNDGE